MTIRSLLFLVLVTLVLGPISHAQSRVRFNCDEIHKANDVDSVLDVKFAYEVQLRCSPKGAGTNIEAASKRAGDKLYFEEEHNVVWIKFRARKGDLNIRIAPDSTADDYDFLLFEEEGDDFLERLKQRKVKPVRTNLARSQGGKAETGINNFAKADFVGSGPNPVHSKAIAVEGIKTFYLAIDNVYENGGGARIYFNSYQSKEIEGVVRDEENKIVPGAEVTWEDSKSGAVLNSTTANRAGEFKMVVVFEPSATKEYTLATFSKDHFYSEINYNGNEILNCSPEPIEVVLPNLIVGKKVTVNNIHFRGNVAKFIMSAYPSLRRLKKLMSLNPSLYLMIEGHTNGCSQSVDCQLLSENRSKAVETYLFERGIDADRIETSGKGASEMLYPISSSSRKQQLNRRVEILVLDY